MVATAEKPAPAKSVPLTGYQKHWWRSIITDRDLQEIMEEYHKACTILAGSESPAVDMSAIHGSKAGNYSISERVENAGRLRRRYHDAIERAETTLHAQQALLVWVTAILAEEPPQAVADMRGPHQSEGHMLPGGREARRELAIKTIRQCAIAIRDRNQG